MQAPIGENTERREPLRNSMAEGADREVMCYSDVGADRLMPCLQPVTGDKILDVFTGTVVLALAASQAVGPAGRVTAIDTAEHLLARLESKISQFGSDNIEVCNMDAAHLDFRRDYFQHSASSGFPIRMRPCASGCAAHVREAA